MAKAKIKLILVIACILTKTAPAAYVYDPNDFATQVIEYAAGMPAGTDYISSLPFTTAANALGRPTIDTTGDNWNIIPVSTHVPVVNVYPAFRSFELVTIGTGGRLILKFNHQVRADENNLYGIDFIVFGNTQQSTGGVYWQNKNPATFMVNSSNLITDEAIVSVSQDGINWYSYTSGPYSDSFAPTFGRVYDQAHPDTSIGAWNLWWGHPTDPTLPLNPAWSAGNFVGKSVAQISQMYGESAGGTGYDLLQSGFEWIQYVKIEGRNINAPEVDSVADVSACGDWKHPFPPGDFTHDCIVDYEDVALLTDFWLDHVTGPENPAADADVYEDDIVNFRDWAIMSRNWLNCSWQCQ